MAVAVVALLHGYFCPRSMGFLLDLHLLHATAYLTDCKGHNRVVQRTRVRAERDANEKKTPPCPARGSGTDSTRLRLVEPDFRAMRWTSWSKSCSRDGVA